MKTNISKMILVSIFLILVGCGSNDKGASSVPAVQKSETEKLQSLSQADSNMILYEGKSILFKKSEDGLEYASNLQKLKDIKGLETKMVSLQEKIKGVDQALKTIEIENCPICRSRLAPADKVTLEVKKFLRSHSGYDEAGYRIERVKLLKEIEEAKSQIQQIKNETFLSETTMVLNIYDKAQNGSDMAKLVLKTKDVEEVIVLKNNEITYDPKSKALSFSYLKQDANEGSIYTSFLSNTDLNQVTNLDQEKKMEVMLTGNVEVKSLGAQEKSIHYGIFELKAKLPMVETKVKVE